MKRYEVKFNFEEQRGNTGFKIAHMRPQFIELIASKL
jgi:hypothetical protein